MAAKEYTWWYKDIVIMCPVCRKSQCFREKCYGEVEEYSKTEEEYCGCLDEDESLSY
jgi:hypothetical protein